MLTIFALPKAFKGHDAVIQTNAIQSWRHLHPSCEIILFGDEKGTAETAAKLEIRHIPDVERNEYGTPLVSSLFSSAQKHASYDYISYVNSDIILMSDFVEAFRQINRRLFLIVGRRWDLDIEEPIDFGNPDWESRLKSEIRVRGTLHGVNGTDYFVFPSGIYTDIPPFAIGRTAWDNWLIYKARALGLPVIDATDVVTIVHQNHDFSHITTVKASGGQIKRKGIEGTHNRNLYRNSLGGDYYAFSLLDATHRLTPTGLKSTVTMSITSIVRRILTLPEIHPGLIPFVQIIKSLRAMYFFALSLAVAVKRGVRKYWLPGSP